jgi:hypothetical protein
VQVRVVVPNIDGQAHKIVRIADKRYCSFLPVDHHVQPLALCAVPPLLAWCGPERLNLAGTHPPEILERGLIEMEPKGHGFRVLLGKAYVWLRGSHTTAHGRAT